MNFAVQKPHRKLAMLSTLVLTTALVAPLPASAQDAVTILPGDQRFNLPEFEDYQAVYSSSSSKTGGFTLHVRKSGDGKKLSITDIIPMMNFVIVAQRQIDLATQRMEFGAGPYFAWGQEYIVNQSDGTGYRWSRNPIGEGKYKEARGTIENKGYVSDMFSPTLAALMPMEIGAKFRLSAAYPRKDETVTAELDSYTVLAKKKLDLDSGITCQCWQIEKKSWSGSIEHIWVSREAPFVFRRTRDVGGKREFTSNLLSYHQLIQ